MLNKSTYLFRRSKLIIPAVLLIACMMLVSCSSGNNAGLLPAFGAGREFSEAETSAETQEENEPVPKKDITICVDPGHGFEDGGAGSELLGDVLEKDITLAVSVKLKEHLEDYGFDVVMTHDGNEFPTTSVDDGNNRFKPQERTAFANSLGDAIDYYVSIHCNSFDTPDVYGSIVFYVDEATKGTVGDNEIAACISDTISEDFPGGNCVANEGPFHVIRYSQVPASLIEIGYVTNSDDAANMLDEEWRDNYAHSIAKALHIYYSGEYTPTANNADSTEGADSPEI